MYHKVKEVNKKQMWKILIHCTTITGHGIASKANLALRKTWIFSNSSEKKELQIYCCLKFKGESVWIKMETQLKNLARNSDCTGGHWHHAAKMDMKTLVGQHISRKKVKRVLNSLSERFNNLY